MSTHSSHPSPSGRAEPVTSLHGVQSGFVSEELKTLHLLIGYSHSAVAFGKGNYPSSPFRRSEMVRGRLASRSCFGCYKSAVNRPRVHSVHRIPSQSPSQQTRDAQSTFCHFGPMLMRASACKSTSRASDKSYSSNRSECVPVRDAVSISWPLSIAYISSQSG